MSPSVARSFDVIERKQSIGPTDQSLLSRLPEHLLTRLFGHATTVQLKTDEVLFLVGDTGDGCYRVDDGLIKVAMVSHAGKERILAFLGSGAIVWRRSSATMSAPAASSFARRSGRAISPPWPALRVKVSAASSTTGSGASWSTSWAVIIASRTKPNYRKRRGFSTAFFETRLTAAC